MVKWYRIDLKRISNTQNFWLFYAQSGLSQLYIFSPNGISSIISKLNSFKISLNITAKTCRHYGYKIMLSFQPPFFYHQFKPLTINTVSSVTTSLKKYLQVQCLFGLIKHANTSRSYSSFSSFGYKHKSDTLYTNRPDLLWIFVTIIQ